MTYTIPLADPTANLETVGGKGASLARLVKAGLPVPDGFHVTTAAYRAFVEKNALQPRILEALQGIDSNRPASFENSSTQIATLFADGHLPADIAAAIGTAYTGLMGRPLPGMEQPVLSVAVRSSATAEDLPTASFAGQHDTYLNISGESALIEAVKKCWASLWTARAIAYRMRQDIDPASVNLAVIVQALVPADSAGILFTANPLDGTRDQILINATWGLGEAIVSGQVTPDTVVVDKASRRIISRETAAKGIMTVRTENGTEELPIPQPLQDQQVLDNATAVELAAYGVQIETQYGLPMDIEWAISGRPNFHLTGAPYHQFAPRRR